METIKLIIDNKEVEVPRGTTILDAAKSVGIHIPTLCYMKLEDLKQMTGDLPLCRYGRTDTYPSGNECPQDGDGADPLESSGGMPDM